MTNPKFLLAIREIVFSLIHIVSDGAVVLGMIMMTEAATRKGDVKKRRIFAIIGLGLVAVFFSLLLSIFRNKAQGYPYRWIEFITQAFRKKLRFGRI